MMCIDAMRCDGDDDDDSGLLVRGAGSPSLARATGVCPQWWLVPCRAGGVSATCMPRADRGGRAPGRAAGTARPPCCVPRR